MRRPDVELSDDAARYVEQHPEEIERLAAPDRTSTAGPVSPARVERFRGYVRERLNAPRTAEADAEAEAFLARYGLARP